MWYINHKTIFYIFFNIEIKKNIIYIYIYLTLYIIIIIMTYSTQLLSFSFPFVINILHAVLLVVIYLKLSMANADMLSYSNMIFSMLFLGRYIVIIIMALVKSKFGSETHFKGGYVMGSLLYYLTILVLYITIIINKQYDDNNICSMVLYIIPFISLVIYLVYSVYYLNDTRRYINIVRAKEEENITFKPTSIIKTVLLPLLAMFDNDVANVLNKKKEQ